MILQIHIVKCFVKLPNYLFLVRDNLTDFVEQLRSLQNYFCCQRRHNGMHTVEEVYNGSESS